jgi:hypothetical protein
VFESVPCAEGPELLVTVTGAIEDTIHWLGLTWNLPEESGVEKSACPTYYKYELEHTPGFSGTIPHTVLVGAWSVKNANVYRGEHEWRHNMTLNPYYGWTGTGIRFYRKNLGFKGTTAVYSNTMAAIHEKGSLIVGNSYGSGAAFSSWAFQLSICGPYYRYSTYGWRYGQGWYTANLGVMDWYISPYAANVDAHLPHISPSFHNWQILDDMFGSYNNNGVTYSWARGQGWPAVT